MPVTQPNIDLRGNISRLRRRCKRLWLPVWADKNGDPITTTAGQLPIKPHWELCSIAVIECTIFKTFTDQQFYNQFNTLNAVEWRSFPRYHAWVANIHTDRKTLGSGAGMATAEDVHYVVLGTDRHGGWRFVHPDVGYVFKEAGVIKSFVADGFPYIGNMDGSTGAKAASVDDMTLLSVDTKEEIDFTAVLGF